MKKVFNYNVNISFIQVVLFHGLKIKELVPLVELKLILFNDIIYYLYQFKCVFNQFINLYKFSSI